MSYSMYLAGKTRYPSIKGSHEVCAQSYWAQARIRLVRAGLPFLPIFRIPPELSIRHIRAIYFNL